VVPTLFWLGPSMMQMEPGQTHIHCLDSGSNFCIRCSGLRFVSCRSQFLGGVARSSWRVVPAITSQSCRVRSSSKWTLLRNSVWNEGLRSTRSSSSSFTRWILSLGSTNNAIWCWSGPFTYIRNFCAWWVGGFACLEGRALSEPPFNMRDRSRVVFFSM
jgi:hypothetical protein